MKKLERFFIVFFWPFFLTLSFYLATQWLLIVALKYDNAFLLIIVIVFFLFTLLYVFYVFTREDKASLLHLIVSFSFFPFAFYLLVMSVLFRGNILYAFAVNIFFSCFVAILLTTLHQGTLSRRIIQGQKVTPIPLYGRVLLCVTTATLLILQAFCAFYFIPTHYHPKVVYTLGEQNYSSTFYWNPLQPCRLTPKIDHTYATNRHRYDAISKWVATAWTNPPDQTPYINSFCPFYSQLDGSVTLNASLPWCRIKAGVEQVEIDSTLLIWDFITVPLRLRIEIIHT